MLEIIEELSYDEKLTLLKILKDDEFLLKVKLIQKLENSIRPIKE